MRAIRKICIGLLLPLYFLSHSPANAENLTNAEIWLAGGAGCNTCDIFTEVRKKRGYGNSLNYTNGNRKLQLPILELDKAKLSQAILAQLPGEQGPGGEYWHLMLTVLIVEDDKVLSFGNIAESADIASAGYRHAIMFPPATPAQDDPALNLHGVYRDFFVDHWNLEYFVEQALHGEQQTSSRNDLELAGQKPVKLALGKRQLVLWGSAKTPYTNSLFISERIREIRQRLTEPGPQLQEHTVTLYGHGPWRGGRDSSYLDGGRIKFMRAGIKAELGARLEDIGGLFAAIGEQRTEKTLLVQVGHSGPSGAPLWGRLSPLRPQSLKQAVADSGTELIMVSGACNSGRFADVGACGFYAAHPDAIASGCQLSADAIRQSDDYLRLFLPRWIRPARRTATATEKSALPKPTGTPPAVSRTAICHTQISMHWRIPIFKSSRNIYQSNLDSLRQSPT